MNDTLFDLPEQLSPKLAWMKKHGVLTYKAPPEVVGMEDELGDEIKAWLASTDLTSQDDCAVGDTEEESVAALARKKGWRLWNEFLF